MSNSSLKAEANRIANEIVKIKNNKDSLDVLFHKLLDDKYKENDMQILVYLSDSLYNLGYVYESVEPFKIKKI